MNYYYYYSQSRSVRIRRLLEPATAAAANSQRHTRNRKNWGVETARAYLRDQVERFRHISLLQRTEPFNRGGLGQSVELDGALQGHVPRQLREPTLHQLARIERTVPVAGTTSRAGLGRGSGR